MTLKVFYEKMENDWIKASVYIENRGDYTGSGLFNSEQDWPELDSFELKHDAKTDTVSVELPGLEAAEDWSVKIIGGSSLIGIFISLVWWIWV